MTVLYRPEHPWPILVAANRDEMINRPWKPPGRHWPDRPDVVAGLDELGKGSWFGLNRNRVAAGIMNRRNTLGPVAGKRSRGELILKALDYPDAKTAARALAHINPAEYRSFNLVIVDCADAYWLRHAEDITPNRIDMIALTPGLNMITAYDCNDLSSPRIRRYLPRFAAASVPDPEHDDWSAWKALLADRSSDPGIGPEGAMNVVTGHGFGTVSSLLLALPALGSFLTKPRWLFAAGRPDEVSYEEVIF